MKHFHFLKFIGKAAQADRARILVKPLDEDDRYDRLGGYYGD